MKKLLTLMTIGACALGFMACDNDDDEPKLNPDTPQVSEGAFVLNQGSYYYLIEGSLTQIDYNTQQASQSVFQKANGRSLGATPQGAIVYGSKIYIGVYESNVIEVIDRQTYKSIKQISLTQAEGQSPRSLVAKDGKVYISMFNGYVSRLDTVSLVIDKTVKVGPNPEIMAIKGNYLYVPNSDGLNYPNYGTTASKIDLSTFTVVKTFDVPLNPAQFVSNGDWLFLLCKGNYYDIPSMIYFVADDDNYLEFDKGNLMAINGDKLYYINAPFDGTPTTYSMYDMSTKKITGMPIDKVVDSPAGIAVDPVNGNIIITSYNIENGYASYNTDGYANVYDNSGKFMNRYETGVGPCMIFFNYK